MAIVVRVHTKVTRLAMTISQREATRVTTLLLDSCPLHKVDPVVAIKEIQSPEVVAKVTMATKGCSKATYLKIHNRRSTDTIM